MAKDESQGETPSVALAPLPSFISQPLRFGFEMQGPLLSSIFRASPPETRNDLRLEDLPLLAPMTPAPLSAAQGVEPPTAVNIPADYWIKIDAGRAALGELRNIATLAKNAKTPEEKERLKTELGRVDALRQAATQAAEIIQNSATKGGLNEFSSIENWQNAAFAAFRGGTGDVALEGVMIGFNMQGLNGLDPTMNSGTAFKELCAHFAPEAARAVGAANAEFMGTWGSNLVVSGVPADKVEAFRETLLDKVITFLSTDQELPSKGIQERCRTRRASELQIRDWSKHRAGIGVTMSHASKTIPRSSFEKAAAGDRDFRLSLVREIVGHLKELGDREAFAADEKVGVKKDAIGDPHHPAIGKGVRPLLRAGENPYRGQKLADIPPFEPTATPQNELTLEDIRNLPSPSRTGGLPIGQLRDLSGALDAARFGGVYDADRFQADADVILQKIDRPNPAMKGTMMELMATTADAALRDYTMPGDAYRIDALEAMGARFFGGGKGFVTQYDIKNFWKINKTYPSGYSDPLMKRLNWVLVTAHEQMGLQTVFLRQGDETYALTAPVTRDGRPVTPELLEKTQTLIDTEGARLFQNYVTQEWGKYPGVMSGLHGEKTDYVVGQDGKVYVKKGALPEAERDNFAATVRRGSQDVLGKAIDPAVPGTLVEVADFQEVGVADRVAKYWRVTTDPITGIETKTIVFVPGGKIPEGYTAIEGRPNWTQSAFVEKPDFRLGVPGNTEAAADLAGKDVKHQKAIIGPDALPAESTIMLGKERQSGWVPFAERYVQLQSTGPGRLGLSFASFGAGITGARLVVGLPVGVATGHWGSVKKLASPLDVMKLGVDFGAMTSAEMATAAFLTRYLKFQAKGMGVHVGGVVMATAAIEALHRGRDFSIVSVGVGTGLTLGITHGATRAVAAVKNATLGTAALDPEPLTKLGAVAVGFVVMEGIGQGVELYQEHQIDQMEVAKREQYGKALRRLDESIEGFSNGGSSEKEFAAAAKDVKRAYVEYAGLLQLYRTPAGKTFREAWGAEQSLRKAELEQDFKNRIKRSQGRPTTFVALNPKASVSDYRRHIAAEPGELTEQYDNLVTKRVKILLERLNLPAEKTDHYLSLFSS